MPDYEYHKLSPEEKEHFATCPECGEVFDKRSLDEALFHHAGHSNRQDANGSSGYDRLSYNQSMEATVPDRVNASNLATTPWISSKCPATLVQFASSRSRTLAVMLFNASRGLSLSR